MTWWLKEDPFAVVVIITMVNYRSHARSRYCAAILRWRRRSRRVPCSLSYRSSLIPAGPPGQTSLAELTEGRAPGVILTR